MKIQFFRYTTGIFPFIALCTCSYAQNSKLSSQLNNTPSKEVAYNDVVKSEGTSSPSADAMASINIKAVKSFTKTFKGQSNAAWFVINGGYLAQFKQDEIKTNVYYDTKGRLIGTILTYQEDKLPKEIRHQVKSTYYDYNIFLVNELTVDDTKVYLVKIEDKTSIKTIRVLDGEMTETESFEKSK